MIDTAILLAAGKGSRLRDVAASKPLCRVAGRPLVQHAICGLRTAGINKVVIVIDYGADQIEDYLNGQTWPVDIQLVRGNADKPNGVSLLAAAASVHDGDVVLAMCDHLVDPGLYRRLAETGAGQGLTLGIDRRLGHDWIDELDVTAVRTSGDHIDEIGKQIVPHDCYDTGVFAIGMPFIDCLERLNDPSLTEGVRLLASQKSARIVDCSDLDWIDVDDAAALSKAEAWFAGLDNRVANIVQPC